MGAQDLRKTRFPFRRRRLPPCESNPSRPRPGNRRSELHAPLDPSDQRIEVGRDGRVRLQILPERPPEHRVMDGFASADRCQQTAPGIRHASANAVQIEAKPHARLEKLPGRVIEIENARLRFLEDSRAHQVAQQAVEGFLVRAAGFRQVPDLSGARLYVVRNPQRGRHMDGPRRG